MSIVEIRRQNLRRWIAEHGTPAKERSLFSQLKADGSFGERVARRLEDDYRMGKGYLDRPLDAGPAVAGEGTLSAVGVEKIDPGELENQMMRKVVEMLETYRLANVTDRARIDLAFSEARKNIVATDEAKPRAR